MGGYERRLAGERFTIMRGSERYPYAFETVVEPPECLYGIGSIDALKEGLAVVGARKASPYGLSCAAHFSALAADAGVTIISGGAKGCDAAAHKAALDAGGSTVVILGGGCDKPYPGENIPLFQRVIDNGGCVISERPWSFEPLGFTFRSRNRLIAALGKAVLITEANLGSGTFSTADAALENNHDVLVIPGSITSHNSRGSNRLLLQGAVPVVDDESFCDYLACIFDMRVYESAIKYPLSVQVRLNTVKDRKVRELLDAIMASPQSFEDLYTLVAGRSSPSKARDLVYQAVSKGEELRLIERQMDGRFCAKVS